MIKATELQIGDWVLVDGTPRKVEAITKKKIGYHRKENEPRLHYARLHDVEPIEITEDLLKKIGFRKEPKNETKYLHELQHAFKLCGVNFEVKL